jgi:large subunit ribosomal protein L18
MKLKDKQERFQKRRWRIRRKVAGTAARPRLTVKLTHQHIYAQLIDDDAGRTLVAATSLQRGEDRLKPNVEGAAAMGERIARKATEQGHGTVVFDRSGRRYHGCVKAFAEAAREHGLQF